MTQSKYILFIVFIAVCMAIGTKTIAADNQDKYSSEQISNLDGLWVGSGDLGYGSSSTYCEGTIPIAFYIRGGIAKSVSKLEKLDFETNVEKDGSIKFKYRGGGKEDIGYGWQPVDVHFSGDLSASSGKGNLHLGNCHGKWTVHKEKPAKAKGIEFIIHYNKLYMLTKGKLERTLKPMKGREFKGVGASGDFFVIHVNGDESKGGTLVYYFENPEEITKVSVIRRAHAKLGSEQGKKEAKGITFSIKENKLYLSYEERTKSIVEPHSGKRFTDVYASGDFFVVHVEDISNPEWHATLLYHFNDANDYSKIGVIRRTHANF